MAQLRSLRRAFVDSPASLGQRARMRRWQTFIETFPAIGAMSVLDLGGTVDYWLRAPVQPKTLHLINLEPGAAEPPPSWMRVDTADACQPPDGTLRSSYDLVYSNSVIEHLGGHQQRRLFAANVLRAAPSHWIQTPYRYFPVEPHWVCPGMQYLPLNLRARLGQHWPLVHTPAADYENALEAQMAVELLSITQMRYYFPSSTLLYDRMFGAVKSIIAVKV
jgi:hypothetical protein